MYAEGKRAHPRVSLTEEEFRRHCETLGLDTDAAALEKHGADVYLCAACLVGCPEATSILEQRILPVAAEAIARVQPGAQFVEETQRIVRERLIYSDPPKIAEYGGRSSLLAWLRVVATRLALNQMGVRQSAIGSQDELTERLVQQYFQGDALIMSGKQAASFQRAMSDAISALDPRDRNVLRMHLLGNCSPEQIGRAYSVRGTTATAWLTSTKKHLVTSVSKAWCDRESELSEEELADISRLVKHQLDFTFRTSVAESSHASSNG